MSSAPEIKVDCPKCLAALNVPAEKGGQRIVCPKCKRSLLVPTAQAAGNSVFDDLFDSPLGEPAEPDAVSQSSDERKIEAKEDSVKGTVKETSGEEVHGKAIDDSVFEDIDLALKEHSESGQSTPEVRAQHQPKQSTATELPPVMAIDEEIELPESIADAPPLPDINANDKDPLAVLQTPAAIDPELDQVELAGGGLTIEDEFSLDEHLEVSDLNLDPIPTGDDPFEEDPNKSLNIDGLSPTIKSEDIYGVKCKVCDTRIHVNIDQVGQIIECPDCFSQVEVKIKKSKSRGNEPRAGKLQPASLENLGSGFDPPEKPKPDSSPNSEKSKPEKAKTELDDEVLKLAPLVEPEPEPESEVVKEDLPQFDHSKLDALDQLPTGDDDPLELAPLEPVESRSSFTGTASKRKTLEREENNRPNPTSNVESGKDQNADGLPDSLDELFDEVDAGAATLKSTTSKEKEAPKDGSKKRKSPKKKSKPEYGSKDYWEEKVTEVEPEVDNTPEVIASDMLMPQHLLAWFSKNFASPDVIFRSLIAILFVGLSYVMFDIFHSSLFDEELTKAQKMLWTLIPAVFGGIAFAIGMIAWAMSCSMVFQNSVNGVASAEEWPGFSPFEWAGPMAMFLFSLWIGSFPGAALGGIVGFVFGQNTWLVIFASLSAFFISPILYSCAAFNGSAFGIFSSTVAKTIGTDDIRWLHYLPFAFALWVVFAAGTLILFLPTFVFSMIGAGLQVFAMICFASLAGIHSARTAHQLEKK